MLKLRRMLFLPLLLGVALGLLGLQLARETASAQVPNVATVNCTSWPGTCTITMTTYIPPGDSFTLTLPDGTSVSVGCPYGCSPGQTYTITSSTSSYTTPQAVIPGGTCVAGTYPHSYYACTTSPAYISVQPQYTTTTAYAYYPTQHAVPGGTCVNGSVPTAYGCTSTSAYSYYPYSPTYSPYSRYPYYSTYPYYPYSWYHYPCDNLPWYYC